MKDKKNFYKFIAVIALSLLSMLILWRKSQGDHLGMVLQSIHPIFLLAGGGAFFVYISMEALAFRYLLKTQGYDILFGEALAILCPTVFLVIFRQVDRQASRDSFILCIVMAFPRQLV